MSGFVIKKGPPEFVLPEGTLDDFFSPEERERCLNVPADLLPDAAAVLYLLPSAFQELDAHIHWKIQARINQREQGGMMVGEVFRDSETGRIYGIVRHLIPSENAGDATYLQFTHEDWGRMLRIYEERFPQREAEERLRIIGWYHTHPNMPTHMSQIDKRTHSSFWGKEWQFSVILNPQRGSWEVFNGEDCGNCCGVLYYNSQWEPSAPPEEPDRDWSRDWFQNQERDYQPGEIRKSEERERGQEQRQDLEQERRQVDSAPVSTGTFIIKHGPELTSDPHTAQQAAQYTAAVEERRHGERKKYRCYPSVQGTSTPTQLVIPMELVHEIPRMMEKRDFPRQASFSLTCQVEINRTSFYPGEDQIYLSDGSLDAKGFEYDNGLNGRLCFRKDAGGAHAGYAILTVLFSETRPDLSALREKYTDSNALLWYNSGVRDLSEVLYFALRGCDTVVHQRVSGFLIKNRPPQEPPPRPNLQGQELFKRWFENLHTGHIFTESSSMDYSRGKRQISSRILEIFFQYLQGYTAIPERVCAAVGYNDLGDLKGERVVPDLERSLEIAIFLENMPRIKFFKSARLRGNFRSCFLFVLANYEVDVKWLRKNMPGYATAFVVNLKDQSYHFYLMP